MYTFIYTTDTTYYDIDVTGNNITSDLIDNFINFALNYHIEVESCEERSNLFLGTLKKDIPITEAEGFSLIKWFDSMELECVINKRP